MSLFTVIQGRVFTIIQGLERGINYDLSGLLV